MKTRRDGAILAAAAGVVAVGLLTSYCAPSAPKGSGRAAVVSDVANAAMKVYVAPGDLVRAWTHGFTDAKEHRRQVGCITRSAVGRDLPVPREVLPSGRVEREALRWARRSELRERDEAEHGVAPHFVDPAAHDA